MQFAIRKLKKILANEQLLAIKGYDRFAKSRVVELKQAIEILIVTKPKRVKKPIQHKPQLNLFK